MMNNTRSVCLIFIIEVCMLITYLEATTTKPHIIIIMSDDMVQLYWNYHNFEYEHFSSILISHHIFPGFQWCWLTRIEPNPDTKHWCSLYVWHQLESILCGAFVYAISCCPYDRQVSVQHWNAAFRHTVWATVWSGSWPETSTRVYEGRWLQHTYHWKMASRILSETLHSVQARIWYALRLSGTIYRLFQS